jgi:1,2-diacylglycerol 3-beta-galactosyltransferase
VAPRRRRPHCGALGCGAPAVRAQARRAAEIGLPVGAGFRGSLLPAPDRAALRRSLGIPAREFVVLVIGGAEGCGGIGRRAAAIVRHLPGGHVVAICGRNRGAERSLTGLAAHAGGRLTVKGLVGNVADWLRCADVVVTKAGPGVIAEAACCGTPMLLTSHLPGQERGNSELAAAAGAGRAARSVRDLVREVGLLHRDPAALEAMRAGCAALARHGAGGNDEERV